MTGDDNCCAYLLNSLVYNKYLEINGIMKTHPSEMDTITHHI